MGARVAITKTKLDKTGKAISPAANQKKILGKKRPHKNVKPFKSEKS